MKKKRNVSNGSEATTDQQRFELAREIYIDLRVMEEIICFKANKFEAETYLQERQNLKWPAPRYVDEWELYHFAQQDLVNGIFPTEEEMIWGDPIWQKFPYAKGDGFLNKIKP